MSFNVMAAAHYNRILDMNRLNQTGVSLRYRYEIGQQQRMSETISEVLKGSLSSS